MKGTNRTGNFFVKKFCLVLLIAAILSLYFPAAQLVNAESSSDATLSAASTIKGAAITDLGAPSATPSSVSAGSVTINAAKAADTSNTGSYITLFAKNNPNAIVKAVKYANGASTASFETDTAYANESISNNDFFMVKVTSEDNATVNYYKVAVTVDGKVPSIYIEGGQIQAAGTKKAELLVYSDEPGTVYYVVTGAASMYAPYPTKEQVLAGKNGYGNPAYVSGNAAITAPVQNRIIIDNFYSYSMTYNIWVVVVDAAGNMTDPHRTDIETPGETASSEAKLDYNSTIKGKSIGYYSVGTPALTIGGVTAGTMELTGIAAADETNAGTYITSIRGTYAGANVKAVKYAEGASTANFETDAAYVNGSISGNDFFIVKVTSEDNTAVNYYKVIVTVKGGLLAKVTNVALSAAGVASWSDVANETGYVVQLYKDGVASGSPVNVAAGSTSYDFLAVMRAGGAGSYTVKVMAKADGTTYKDGSQSDASPAQAVIQLATVSAGLTWTGNVAHWVEVPNAVSYDVQLYKDGITARVPVNVTAANAQLGVDFRASMAAAGAGTYTYKVKAKGNTTLILDAAASLASNDNIKLPPSNDATLSAASTIKGVTITDLGTPSATPSSVSAGRVEINATKAANTSNTGTYITLFAPNNPGASVKAVKYAYGASTTNFETDAAYANGAISNNDFFMVKVTAEDNVTVKYYKVAVTFDGKVPSIYIEDGQIQAAGTKKAELLVYSDEPGTVYYVVTGAASIYAPYPTKEQVLAGKNGYGNPAYVSGNAAITAPVQNRIIIDNFPGYSMTYNIWVVVVDAAGNMTDPHRTDIKTPGETAGSEAKLDYNSTIKGKSIGYYSVGTPASTIGGVTAGTMELSGIAAADGTNAGLYITSIRGTYAGATVKAVKYADGASTANFETDAAYASGPISNNDFFIVKVTSEDNTAVNYYKVIVTVKAS